MGRLYLSLEFYFDIPYAFIYSFVGTKPSSSYDSFYFILERLLKIFNLFFLFILFILLIFIYHIYFIFLLSISIIYF
jgi:hypothetical protein